MADHLIAPGHRAAHGKTLMADVEDSVTFPQHVGQIEVVNVAGTAEIFFTTDGSTPTVGGGNTHFVPASMSARVVANTGQSPVVRLVASGETTYSVSGD